MSGAKPAMQHSPDARAEAAGCLYLTPDLLARHSEAAGGMSRLERLRIDGLRRRDRIRTLENLGSLPCLMHLELPCHAIASMAPVLACSVSRHLVFDVSTFLVQCAHGPFCVLSRICW